MKYIMFDTGDMPLFVVFSENAQHKAIATALAGVDVGVSVHPVKVGKPIAAGFVNMDNEGVYVHGSSESLGVGTTDEARKWAKVLRR